MGVKGLWGKREERRSWTWMVVVVGNGQRVRVWYGQGVRYG